MFARAADPTPEQIRKVCLQIQDGWSDDERKRRAVICENPAVTLDKLHRIRGVNVHPDATSGE